MMAKDELETVLDLDSQRLDTLTSMVTIHQVSNKNLPTLPSEVLKIETSAAIFSTFIL